MTSVTALPQSRPLTYADLEATPMTGTATSCSTA